MVSLGEDERFFRWQRRAKKCLTSRLRPLRCGLFVCISQGNLKELRKPPRSSDGPSSADRNEAAITLAAVQPDLAKALSSKDKQVRLDAYNAALKEHDRRVASLLVLARQEPEKAEYLGTRELAIDLLARYGEREAIPVYVRSIEYSVPALLTQFSSLNGYPCALALSKHGLSAQLEVFAFLGTTPREKVSDEAIELYADLMPTILCAGMKRRSRSSDEPRNGPLAAGISGDCSRSWSRLPKTGRWYRRPRIRPSKVYAIFDLRHSVRDGTLPSCGAPAIERYMNTARPT